jgi:hypothetical protein
MHEPCQRVNSLQIILKKVYFQSDKFVFAFHFCRGKGLCAGFVTACDSCTAKNCHPAARAAGNGPWWARMAMPPGTEKGRFA